MKNFKSVAALIIGTSLLTSVSAFGQEAPKGSTLKFNGTESMPDYWIKAVENKRTAMSTLGNSMNNLLTVLESGSTKNSSNLSCSEQVTREILAYRGLEQVSKKIMSKYHDVQL